MEVLLDGGEPPVGPGRSAGAPADIESRSAKEKINPIKKCAPAPCFDRIRSVNIPYVTYCIIRTAQLGLLYRE